MNGSAESHEPPEQVSHDSEPLSPPEALSADAVASDATPPPAGTEPAVPAGDEAASDAVAAAEVSEVPSMPAVDVVPQAEPAEQLSLEAPELETAEPETAEPDVAAAATSAEAEIVRAEDVDEMPDDLRAVTEALEQPTGEIAAVTAETGAVAAEGAGTEVAEGVEQAAEEAQPVAEALDEIAPGTVAVAEPVPEAEAELEGVGAPITTVSWWPFIAYDVVWLAAAAYSVWQLEQLPAGTATFDSTLYTMTMLGGLVLLALGPVLLLIVWLASWIGRPDTRKGLMFISALLKGAAATLIGAVIWIAALLIVDYLRLGRPF